MWNWSNEAPILNDDNLVDNPVLSANKLSANNEWQKS